MEIKDFNVMLVLNPLFHNKQLNNGHKILKINYCIYYIFMYMMSYNEH